MNYDLHKAGFLSATPYLALAIQLFVFGYIADWVQMKKYLTTTQVRCVMTRLVRRLNKKIISIVDHMIGHDISKFRRQFF